MQILEKLFAEKDFTFKKAFETAQSSELSNKDFRDTSVPVDDTVNKVGKYASPGHSTKEAVSCFRCGGKHFLSGCWASSVQCYKCHTKGRFAKMCVKKGEIQSTRYFEVDSPITEVLLKSSLNCDCTLSRLKDKVDQGFKFSCCWRVSQSAWKLTRDQRCPSSLRWSIRSGLRISNCS